MRKCKFLSNALPDNPDTNALLEEQYLFFDENFIKNTTYFRGFPVIVKHVNDKNNYGTILSKAPYNLSCFAHLVSKKINQNSKIRELDKQRLRCVKWVKELIEKVNENDPKCINCRFIKIADVVEHKKNVTYIYCMTVRYVIILEKAYDNNSQQIYYFIRSAYYVNEENKHISILKKF